MKRASPFADSRIANFSTKELSWKYLYPSERKSKSEPDENNLEVQPKLTGSELADLGMEEQLQRVPTHLHMLYTAAEGA